MDGLPPIWTRWIARVLAAWMLAVVGVTLGAWRLAELAPVNALLGLGVGLYAVAPIALLIWSLWHMFHEPVGGWMAPSAFFMFAGAMVPAVPALIDAGARLNFEDHRPVYDAIVADAKAGRLSGTPGADGWVAANRDGVRYRFAPARAGEVVFVWVEDAAFEAGVRYDDTPCRPRPGVRCVVPGQPLDGDYTRYQLTF